MKKIIIYICIIVFAIFILKFSYSMYYINKNCDSIPSYMNAAIKGPKNKLCGEDYKGYNLSEKEIIVEKHRFNNENTELIEVYALKPNEGFKPDLSDGFLYKFLSLDGDDTTVMIQFTNKKPQEKDNNE